MGEFIRQRLPSPVEYHESEGRSLVGAGKWKTTHCVFHEERNPSLRINTESGGWICMGCGAKGGDVLSFHMEHHGMEFVEAAKALGCWEESGQTSKAKPLPFSARSALEVIRFESLVCAVVAADAASGAEVSEFDKARAMHAAGRIQFICEAIAQ